MFVTVTQRRENRLVENGAFTLGVFVNDLCKTCTTHTHTHTTSFRVGCKKQIYYLFRGPELYKYCVTPRPICIKYVCWRSIRYSLKSCISFQTGFCNRIRNLLMENHTPTRPTPAPRRCNSRVFYVTPHRFAALFFLHSSIGMFGRYRVTFRAFGEKRFFVKI